MRFVAMATVLLALIVGNVCAPVFADQNPPVQTPVQPVVEPAPVTPPPPPPPPPAAPKPAAAPAPGSPLQLKLGDATFRFGFLLQPQADFSQNQAGGYGQNFLLRRVRFIVGGQVTKSVFFFYETENSRLGNAAATGAKSFTTGFQTLDAVAEWRPKKVFNIAGGLIRVPTSRDALDSAASEFTIDANAYAFTATGVLGGSGGRDTGVQFRGYLLDDRFEYRAVIVSGLREAGSRNAFRKVARVQYNFFDKEVYNLPSYQGNNFGTKKILVVGGAYDTQLGYRGVTADVFADFPVAFGSANGTLTYQKLDGGDRLVTQFGDSDIITADAGLFFKGTKLGPWVKYEKRDFSNVSNRDEKRVLVGLNYYPFANNVNIKTAYGRFSPPAGRDTNQIILQVQIYYY